MIDLTQSRRSHSEPVARNLFSLVQFNGRLSAIHRDKGEERAKLLKYVC